MTALFVENIVELAPAAKHIDLAGEPRSSGQPFEHRDIRVKAILVLVDTRIRHAAGHLVVPRIRNCKQVGDFGATADRGMAEQLALVGHLAPEERHQDLAALQRIRIPVAVTHLGL